MLSKQLKELGQDEIITRTEYVLMDLGRKLIPVLLALRNWGIDCEKHLCGGETIFNPDEYERLNEPFEMGLE